MEKKSVTGLKKSTPIGTKKKELNPFTGFQEASIDASGTFKYI